jgi:phage terminase small subunit
MQREFVRYFTDIQLPCYRKAKAAALAAGYAESVAVQAGTKILTLLHIRDEVERIDMERVQHGKEMAEMLWDARFEAVRNLLGQMNEGGHLSLIDLEAELGKGLKKIKDRNVAERAREMNKHNGNVLLARRQAREAAEKVLAYTLGEPEQVIRHKKDGKPGEKALAGLTDEDLIEVGRKVKGLLEERVGDTGGTGARPHAALTTGRVVEIPPQSSSSE